MDYDVIIVGGGPAGASAAIAAGRAGLSALVLEKAGRGRDKFCAGGVSYATRSRLAEMGAKEVEEAFEAEIDGYIVALPDGRALVGSLGSRVGATVRRSVFDAKLAEVAEALGAEVRWGSRAVAAEARGGSVEVRTADGQLLRGRYLIVATGAGDPLPERLGFPSWRRTDLGHCWGSEVPYDGSGLLARWRERYGVSPVLLLFGFMRYGYFWAFPKRAHLNLGVGTSLLESARGAHRRIFADCLSAAERAGLLEGVAARVDRSWLVPLRPRGWSPRNPRGVTWSAEKRALLVGDAAGLWVYYHHAYLLPEMFIAVVPGVVVGATLGAKVALRVKASIVKYAVMGVMLVSGIQLIIRGISSLI